MTRNCQDNHGDECSQSTSKRERNRVAQRKYRQRVKQKIHDLQTRLHHKEAQLQASALTLNTSEQHDANSSVLLNSTPISETPSQSLAISTVWSEHSPQHARALSQESRRLVPIAGQAKPDETAAAIFATDRSFQDLSSTHFLTITKLARIGGFRTVDEFVTAYYTSSVRSIPRLANQQRLSRKRGLPRIVSSVCTAACQWAVGEEQAIHREVIVCTETIVAKETQQSQKSLQLALRRLAAGDNSTLVAQLSEQLREHFMNKAPHLWTLLNSLATSNGLPHDTDASNRTLAAACLLVYCADQDDQFIWKAMRSIAQRESYSRKA